MPVPEHGLSKAVWTDDDYVDMAWHDATIWAYSFQKADTDDVSEDAPLPPDRLLLDLDYITRWVDPVKAGGAFEFWVAPVTLVFDNVSDLTVVHSSEPADAASDMEVAHLHRADDHWHIEGHTFDVRLRADGFRQVFRAVPRRGLGQRLALLERGGYCYDESPVSL